MKMIIKEAKRDHRLPNRIGDVVKEVEVEVVVNEAIEAVLLSSKEMINISVKRIGRLSQHHHQNRKVPLSMT